MQVLGDPVGGVRKHVHELIRGLARAGVVSSYAYGLKPDGSFASEIESVLKCTRGAVTYDLRKRPHISDIGNVRLLADYVRQSGVEVVHGHGAKGGAYARLVSRICGVKSVYTPHGGSIHPMFSLLENTAYRVAEKALLPLTDALIFESHYTERTYRERIGVGKARSLVNHHGIGIPQIGMIAAQAGQLAYSLRFPNVIHIGVFGTLRFQKGQEFGIRAFAELVREGFSAMIHFFGDGPDRVTLQDIAERLGVAKLVVFHGHVKEPEAHMYCMDIVLIPSRFESFGYVALEAMSLSKVVIATNTGGLREIVENGRTGILVNFGQIRELRDALAFYVMNKCARVQFGANGHKRLLDYFTVDRMLRTTRDIYYNLVRR